MKLASGRGIFVTYRSYLNGCLKRLFDVDALCLRAVHPHAHSKNGQNCS